MTWGAGNKSRPETEAADLAFWGASISNADIRQLLRNVVSMPSCETCCVAADLMGHVYDW